MDYLNKKTIYKPTFIVFLIIITMILRLPWIAGKSKFIYLNNGMIYALIYFGLFITWGISIKRRIIQKQTLMFLLGIVALIVFWFMVRTIKFIYIEEGTNIERWFWYAYYIPMILIPLISLFISLSLGKLEDYRLPNWTKLIYIPTIVLIVFVLTNDFHQMVFMFPEGGLWTGKNFEYGIVYWIIFIWVTLAILASLVITIIKSRLPHNKKILWLPFIPYSAGFIYAVLYVMGLPFLRVIAGDMTAIFCLIIIAIFESLIQSGLIRSNIHYEELFYGSDIRAQILNEDYQVCYETGFTPVEADDNIRISSIPISGGRIIWKEDISEMNGLIKELEEVNQRLSEENNLLIAELELKERKIKIDEKIRIYDNLTKKIEPQLKAINGTLSEDGGDIDILRERLVQICVLGTYIKRRSNLFILREDNKIFSGKEIEHCLRESLEAMSMGEIDTSLKSNCKGDIEAKNAVLAYDLFEEIIEAVLLSITALFVNLNIANGNIKMKLQIGSDKEDQGEDKINAERFKSTNQLIESGGHIIVTEEDDSVAITIELPKAGENS